MLGQDKNSETVWLKQLFKVFYLYGSLYNLIASPRPFYEIEKQTISCLTAAELDQIFRCRSIMSKHV